MLLKKLIKKTDEQTDKQTGSALDRQTKMSLIELLLRVQ